MLVDPFDVLAKVARELCDDAAVADVLALRGRVNEGRFFVACIGQFKRGKSTLLNALVGAPVLPIGVTPVTAVVTVLRHGRELRARIRTQQSPDWLDVPIARLDEFVSEDKNPENAKGVRAVEVEVPSELLASGMCLVDTPGVGSVFAGNTAATREFVPHVDAALVVLGADPPISGEEASLVAEVARSVEHLLFVINKADRLGEADVAQARAFTGNVLARQLLREPPPILVVSATERAAGVATRDWPQLEERLVALARDAGADLVDGARRRGLARIGLRLAHAVDEHRAALLRPLDESDERVKELSRAVGYAEQTLPTFEPLFQVEEQSLRRVLERQRVEFLAQVQASAMTELRRRLTATNEAPRTLRTRVFDLAQDVAREHVEAWARRVRPEAEMAYRRATEQFVTLMNGFLQSLRARAPDVFSMLPHEVEPESGFRTRSRFHFTEMLTIASPSPAAAVLYALRSRDDAIGAACKRAAPYLARLLDTNTARVINDVSERVRESGRRLLSEIRTLLREVAETARRGADRARTSRARGEDAVRAELARLDALARDVGSVAA